MKFEKHCWAEVDLDALTENFRWIHRHVGGDVCCVVKANAYGHGSCAAADALQAAGAAAFAVSCLAEARELRRHGIDKPILILGYTDPDFADELAGLHITQALFSTQYAEALSTAATAAGCRVECHLKADTGIHFIVIPTTKELITYKHYKYNMVIDRGYRNPVHTLVPNIMATQRTLTFEVLPVQGRMTIDGRDFTSPETLTR